MSGGEYNPQSRMEVLLVRLIEEQEKTNGHLADIKKRMPFWPTMADFAEIVRRGERED